jgi:predicted  nucleic acid-binding Zn-ribbon protein
MVTDSERDADAVQGRINEMRHGISDLETQLATLEARQSETRASLDADRARLDGDLAAARGKRDALAAAVPRAMLGTYDRVRSRRRAETVFPLRGATCSACDTAVPTQRRAAMAASGSLETCEGCGVLLYAGE